MNKRQAVNTNLHSHDNRVQVQHRLPVLTQDVQTHVALQVDIRVVDLLSALNLGRVMREVLVDREVEMEDTTLVHALVRLDTQGEVQDIIGVGEGHFHRVAEGQLLEIWPRNRSMVSKFIHVALSERLKVQG